MTLSREFFYHGTYLIFESKNVCRYSDDSSQRKTVQRIHYTIMVDLFYYSIFLSICLVLRINFGWLKPMVGKRFCLNLI